MVEKRENYDKSQRRDPKRVTFRLSGTQGFHRGPHVPSNPAPATPEFDGRAEAPAPEMSDFLPSLWATSSSLNLLRG